MLSPHAIHLPGRIRQTNVHGIIPFFGIIEFAFSNLGPSVCSCPLFLPPPTSLKPESSVLMNWRTRRSRAQRDRLPQAARRANAVSQHVQPMLHSGGVRAFSHLPAKRLATEPTGPLSQRGAQAIGGQFQRTESQDAATPPGDGIAAAKASGVFDVVRQQFNRDDSPHFMDEDGTLRPRDEARQQDSPSPRDPRSPLGVAGAPPRPAWNTGNAAAANSSRSPRTSSFASDATRPWYMPPITPEDLDPQHSDDDDAAGSRSAPTGRPEAHDLVYRTHGESTPKPGLQDLVYRFNGSPEEAEEHSHGYFQNAASAQEMTPVAGVSQPPPTSAPSAQTRQSLSKSEKRHSEDKPLGYKKPKKSPLVKNDALIQKNKVIKSATIPKSERGLAVLREFFNPDAKNIDELYSSMRAALVGDKALVLQLNSNGEHSGMIVIHLDDKGNLVNTLYDPAGSYTGKNHEKGSGDVLTNELPTNGPQHVGWSLADYIEHHAADGSMSFVPIWTDGDTARKLEFPANTMGGFCADSSCQVIQQIPGFTKSGIFGPYWPDSLSDQLHGAMGRKVTIEHQP